MAEKLQRCDLCQGPAILYCTACSFNFCHNCQKLHVRLFKGHEQHELYVTIQGIDLANVNLRCNYHEEDLDLFCFDDDKPICKICLMDHTTCKISKLEEATNKIDLIIRQEKLLTSVQNFLSEIKDARSAIHVYLSFIHVKRARDFQIIIDKIEKEFKAMRRKVHMDLLIHAKTTQAVLHELDERIVKAYEMVDKLDMMKSVPLNAEKLVSTYKLEQLLEKQYMNFLKMPTRKSNAILDQMINIDLTKLQDAINDLRLCQITKIDQSDFRIKLTIIISFKLFTKDNPNFIRGCAVLPNDILCFTDHNVGLIVRYSSGLIRTFELLGSPVDITSIGANRIAVSLRKRRSVVIITLNENETEEIQIKEYKFKDIGSIRSLAYDGENIIIQIESFGFYILDHSGNINGKIQINEEINMQYVSCRDDTIYYTKSDTNTITSCDRTGKILWEFQDGNILKSPIGVAVDEKGNVFATGLFSNNVVAISPSGKYCVELLCHNENLNRPHVVDYNSTNKELLVCSSNGDAVLFSVDNSYVVK